LSRARSKQLLLHYLKQRCPIRKWVRRSKWQSLQRGREQKVRTPRVA
jgi:hypothetical protein